MLLPQWLEHTTVWVSQSMVLLVKVVMFQTTQSALSQKTMASIADKAERLILKAELLTRYFQLENQYSPSHHSKVLGGAYFKKHTYQPILVHHLA